MRASFLVVVSRYSGRAEHALAEQREAAAARQSALEEREAMHLALHLPIAPRKNHSGEDGVVIATEAGGERPEFAAFRGGQPGRERVRILGREHLDQFLHERMYTSECRARRGEHRHVRPIRAGQIARLPAGEPEQPCGLARGRSHTGRADPWTLRPTPRVVASPRTSERCEAVPHDLVTAAEALRAPLARELGGVVEPGIGALE